jgi:Xaa-Pro dipeptidase
MSDAAATGVFEARLDAVRSAAADAGLHAVLATSDASIAYLTGFSSIQLERLFAVAVPVHGRPTIVVPHLESEAIADVPPSFERVVYPASSDGMADLVAALGEGAAVGVEEDHLVYGRALALSAAGKELRPAGRILMALREAKDAAEIERIRHAVDIVERVMARMFDELGEGDVEHAVNAKVSNLLREAGATDAHALVLFGANAANPHGKPGARQLRRGEVICADISAQIDGYWADLTRCGSAGEPSEWARAAWDVVMEAQTRAIEVARAGATGRDVDAAQRTVVEASPELGACLHGAGHAIGIDVHEPPFLTPRGNAPMAAGTVLTIEPGIYAAGIGGIRIEDVVVVTDGEPTIISSLPRELVVPPAFATAGNSAEPLSEEGSG